MVHTPDLIIPPTDGPIYLAGAAFHIVHTPGHSSGHVCAITPDNVCYAGDALMSLDRMDAKLPYGLGMQLCMESRERLRDLPCSHFIMAHRGVCTDIGPVIDANQQLVLRRAAQIRALIQQPMHFSDICAAVCRELELRSRRPRRAVYYERNIRLFVEFLLDRGELVMENRDGVGYLPDLWVNPPDALDAVARMCEYYGLRG